MTENDPFLMFFQVLNDRDLETADTLLDPRAELFFPKTKPIIGKERILKFLKILFRSYSELTFSIQRVIHEGNQAAVHWIDRGVNRKNEPYENEGVTILELKMGKIVFISDFFKNTEQW
jgi:ketosteroid isomerase-like protein